MSSRRSLSSSPQDDKQQPQRQVGQFAELIKIWSSRSKSDPEGVFAKRPDGSDNNIRFTAGWGREEQAQRDSFSDGNRLFEVNDRKSGEKEEEEEIRRTCPAFPFFSSCLSLPIPHLSPSFTLSLPFLLFTLLFSSILSVNLSLTSISIISTPHPSI